MLTAFLARHRGAARWDYGRKRRNVALAGCFKVQMFPVLILFYGERGLVVMLDYHRKREREWVTQKGLSKRVATETPRPRPNEAPRCEGPPCVQHG